MGTLVSAIIVSYNTRELLRRALRSALGRPGLEVEGLVVDNASQDGSAEMVAEEFPQVVLVRSAENRGFAAGVNQGLQRARGEYVLLLNPDAELLGDGLERMVEFLAGHPRVAAVGPRLVYGDGSRQHAAFAFPTLPMIFLDFFPLHGRLLDSRLNGRYPPAAAPHPIGHPLGACMLLRRQALAEVGPFDERFFMYCEEVDWCLRAWQQGWQVYHLPQAVARHLGGQSVRQRRDAMFVELHRSRLRLYRKHYSLLFRELAGAITRLGLWAEARRARREAGQGLLSASALAGRLDAFKQIRKMMKSEA
ncbi:MAG: glycosyltransferase family 2 protein [Chloroflexi bacterium]|nr:glycosyltransferase family 2 protein [Chloroflexota bacterium]